MDWIVRVSNPVRGSKFFSFSNRAHLLWGQPSFQFSGYEGSLPGVTRPVRCYPPGFSVEVKSEWSYTSVSPVCFYGVNSEHCVFHMAMALFVLWK